jgi:hypothetical protein
MIWGALMAPCLILWPTMGGLALVTAVAVAWCKGRGSARGRRDGGEEFVEPLMGRAFSATDGGEQELSQFAAARNASTPNARRSSEPALVRMLPTPEELPLSRLPPRLDTRVASGILFRPRCREVCSSSCERFARVALPLWLTLALGTWDLAVLGELFNGAFIASAVNLTDDTWCAGVDPIAVTTTWQRLRTHLGDECGFPHECTSLFLFAAQNYTCSPRSASAKSSDEECLQIRYIALGGTGIPFAPTALYLLSTGSSTVALGMSWWVQISAWLTGRVPFSAELLWFVAVATSLAGEAMFWALWYWPGSCPDDIPVMSPVLSTPPPIPLLVVLHAILVLAFFGTAVASRCMTGGCCHRRGLHDVIRAGDSAELQLLILGGGGGAGDPCCRHACRAEWSFHPILCAVSVRPPLATACFGIALLNHDQEDDGEEEQEGKGPSSLVAVVCLVAKDATQRGDASLFRDFLDVPQAPLVLLSRIVARGLRRHAARTRDGWISPARLGQVQCAFKAVAEATVSTHDAHRLAHALARCSRILVSGTTDVAVRAACGALICMQEKLPKVPVASQPSAAVVGGEEFVALFVLVARSAPEVVAFEHDGQPHEEEEEAQAQHQPGSSSVPPARPSPCPFGCLSCIIARHPDLAFAGFAAAIRAQTWPDQSVFRDAANGGVVPAAERLFSKVYDSMGPGFRGVGGTTRATLFGGAPAQMAKWYEGQRRREDVLAAPWQAAAAGGASTEAQRAAGATLVWMRNVNNYPADVLGMGSQGVVFRGVYRALDPAGTPVAIKRVHAHVLDSGCGQDERTILARLRHPNIVQCVRAWLSDSR